jgi:hypothetical protein
VWLKTGRIAFDAHAIGIGGVQPKLDDLDDLRLPSSKASTRDSWEEAFS